MIIKVSNTRWNFNGFFIDLDDWAQKVDLVSECSHHPRESIARLRSIFSKPVSEFTFWKRNTAWGDLLNLNNKVEQLPDNVFTAIGSVTNNGTWRSSSGKINGYPFSHGEWHQIVPNMKGDYPPLPSR